MQADTIKKYWPQIALGVAASGIAIFGLLKANSMRKGASTVEDPFKEIID